MGSPSSVKVAAMCFRCERPFYRKPSNLRDYLVYGSVWLCDDCLRGLNGEGRRTALRRLPVEAARHLGKVVIAVRTGAATALAAAHRHLRLVPLVEPPDYAVESKQILKEITPRRIKAKNSITRRVVVQNLGYDYTFRPHLYSRILVFGDLMEARGCFDCVQRMEEYTRSGFQLRFLSSTILLAQVKGKHWL